MSVEGFIWHQVIPNQGSDDGRPGSEEQQDDRALMLAIPNVGEGATAHLQEDSRSVIVKDKSGKEVQNFKLYEKVFSGPEGQTHGEIETQVQENGMIVLLLLKQDREMWTQLVDLPIAANDPALVDQAVMDQLIQLQVPSLPTGAQEESVDRNSLHPITLMQLDNLKDEKDQITTKLQQYEKQLEGDADTASTKVLLSSEKDELRRRLGVLQSLSSINARLRAAMEKTVTVKQMLEIQQIEIEKARSNAGSDGPDETEEYKDEEEAKLDCKEITEKAMLSIQVKTKEGFMEGMRLLRVAALQQNDPSASIILFRLYNEMEEHGKAAYFLVRRAAMDDCEPMCNAMVGSLHDDGMQLFPPWTGMALYYYQRAAKSGRQCMMDLSNLWRKGFSKGAEELVKKTGQKVHPDPERQIMWLQHSIARGSGVAMFIKAQLHMQGENGFKQSKKEAVEAWSRALAAAPQLQQQQAEMEKMLSLMPNDGETASGVRGVGASPGAAAASSPPIPASFGEPDMSEFGTTSANSEGSFLTSAAGHAVLVCVVAIGVAFAVPPVRRAVLSLFGK